MNAPYPIKNGFVAAHHGWRVVPNSSFFSLSLDIIKDLTSLIIRGEFLSEALTSLIEACVSIIVED